MAPNPFQEVAMLPYRPCVGMMVINRAGLIWVGRRADGKTQDEGHGDWWQMPQGGIDEGEDPARAALRELDEETAIGSVTIIGESKDWLTYDLPPHLVGVAWQGRYRGQRQKWFAMRFTGDDAEVDINPRAGHEREFTSWRWAPLDSLLPAVIPFKRKVYTEIVREFGALATPL